MGVPVGPALQQPPIASHKIGRARTQRRRDDQVIFRVARNTRDTDGDRLDDGIDAQRNELARQRRTSSPGVLSGLSSPINPDAKTLVSRTAMITPAGAPPLPPVAGDARR